MKTVIVFIVVIVVLTNVPPITFVLDHKDCSYSNYNGSFTFDEMNLKERDFDMGMYKFSEYKKVSKEDTVLYRLCKKNYLKFWNWGAYLFQQKYHLPYMNWEEIQSRRGPVSAKSGFQDF